MVYANSDAGYLVHAFPCRPIQRLRELGRTEVTPVRISTRIGTNSARNAMVWSLIRRQVHVPWSLLAMSSSQILAQDRLMSQWGRRTW